MKTAYLILLKDPIKKRIQHLYKIKKNSPSNIKTGCEARFTLYMYANKTGTERQTGENHCLLPTAMCLTA